MCPVYYVNDVTGLHRNLILPFKGSNRVKWYVLMVLATVDCSATWC